MAREGWCFLSNLETSALSSPIRAPRESRSQTPMLPQPASSWVNQGWDQVGKERKCHRRVKITAGSSGTVSVLSVVSSPSGSPKIPCPHLSPSGDLQAHQDLGNMEL